MAAAHALVLFDIDGTLLRRAGPHHKEALVAAVREVTNHEASFDGIDTSGMLDRDLIRMLLVGCRARVKDINGWMPSIISCAQTHYQMICPELQDKVCPGVPEFLHRLKDAAIPA